MCFVTNSSCVHRCRIGSSGWFMDQCFLDVFIKCCIGKRKERIQQININDIHCLGYCFKMIYIVSTFFHLRYRTLSGTICPFTAVSSESRMREQGRVPGG